MSIRFSITSHFEPMLLLKRKVHFCLSAFLFLSLHSISGQNDTLLYPLIEGYGGVFELPNPQLPSRAPHILIDLVQRPGESEEVNPGLDRIARLVNLYGLAGYPADSLDIVVIVHGGALSAVLNDEGCQRFLGENNASKELIAQLSDLGVAFMVCGQALMHRGYGTDFLLPEVTLGLSAITVLVDYQQKGYVVLNF